MSDVIHKVDDVVRQCVFNALIERLDIDDITVRYSPAKKARPSKVIGHPEGAVSGMYWAVASNDARPLALVHCYLDSEGTILASGKRDPKTVRIPHYRIMFKQKSGNVDAV